jgi:hypothetical protein
VEEVLDVHRFDVDSLVFFLRMFDDSGTDLVCNVINVLTTVRRTNGIHKGNLLEGTVADGNAHFPTGVDRLPNPRSICVGAVKSDIILSTPRNNIFRWRTRQLSRAWGT